MTTEQTVLLTKAKRGDVRALASLLNRTLERGGIKAYVSGTDGHLKTILESIKPVSSEKLKTWLEKALHSLDSPVIKSIELSARQPGQSVVLWTEFIQLRDDSFKHDLDEVVEGDIVTELDSRELPAPPKPATSIISAKSVEDAQASALSPLPYGIPALLLTLKTCFINPFKLPDICERLHRKTAMYLGLSLGGFYLLCMLVGISRTDLGILELILPNGALPLILILNFLGFVLATTLVRKLFRGKGSVEGDFFCIGCMFMLMGILSVIVNLLGITNIELVVAFGLLYVVYSVLILYVCCVRIANIIAPLAPVAVASVLILGIYINKVLITMVFANRSIESF